MSRDLLLRGNNAFRTRRAVLQVMATAAGSLLLITAARPGPAPSALAQDTGYGNDDMSGQDHGGEPGHGGGGGGGGNSVHVAPAPTGMSPLGAIKVRIVSMNAGGFVPGNLTVDVGQMVTFVNSHSVEHTATGSGFDTGVIPPGGETTVVLDTPGIFPYACRIHPVMTGQIAVRDASGVVPSPMTWSAPAADSGAAVSIANFAFNPATISVPAGGTVTWRNDDATAHTVTADGGQFDSGTLNSGASFTWTFSEPGSVAYHCQIHPSMQGSVMVTS